MTTLNGRLDRLERAHPRRGIAHPDDGDGAAIERRLVEGECIEDLSDRALITVLEYWNARAWGDPTAHEGPRESGARKDGTNVRH